jgi:hypothetical protein
MKHTHQNCLKHILDLPQVWAWDMGDLRLRDMQIAARRFIDAQSGDRPQAECEAIRFYALNHLMSIVKRHYTPHQPLPITPLSIAIDYRNCLIEQAQRVMYYIALITTREFRHAWEGTHLSAEIREEFEKVIGPTVMRMQKHMRGKDYSTAIDVMGEEENMTLREFFTGVEYVFNNGSFSAGYGGPPWGRITNCLVRTINGQYSPEVMVDTSYTLAHNNGAMHNKGMLYGGVEESMLHILDVQRSGQIPEMILENRYFNEYTTSSLRTAVRNMKHLYPEEIGDFVNWFKVRALGAVKDCQPMINEMLYLHPEMKDCDMQYKISEIGKVAVTSSTYAVDQFDSLPIIKRVA